MRGDEEEEGGGRRRRDGRRRALLANVVKEGKQNDIILKVPKLFAFGAVLADVVKEGKQNDMRVNIEATRRCSRQRRSKAMQCRDLNDSLYSTFQFCYAWLPSSR